MSSMLQTFEESKIETLPSLNVSIEEQMENTNQGYDLKMKVIPERIEE